MRITRAILKNIEDARPFNKAQIDFMVLKHGEKWREKARRTKRFPKNDWMKFLELSGDSEIIEKDLNRINVIKEKRVKAKKPKKEVKGSDFYIGNEWRRLRVKVLEKYNCKCMMCGRSPKDHGIVIHVDHIKPKSLFPELKLEESNLQILCEDCNIGKSNDYITDYRPH